MVLKIWKGPSFPESPTFEPPQKAYITTGITMDVERGYRGIGFAFSLTIDDCKKKFFITKNWKDTVEEIKTQTIKEFQQIVNDLFQKIQDD